MNIKELLLNGKAFLALLNDFAIEAKNVIIHHEELLLSQATKSSSNVIKETVSIEGRNEQGVFTFVGTLHFNLLNQLAVFEMQDFEKIKQVN